MSMETTSPKIAQNRPKTVANPISGVGVTLLETGVVAEAEVEVLEEVGEIEGAVAADKVIKLSRRLLFPQMVNGTRVEDLPMVGNNLDLPNN